MRQLIIDLDKENDPSKEKQVLQFLTNLGVHFHTSERQTIEEYNAEIAESEAQIERGEFITAEDLKREAKKW
jgi:hypothetical protein